MNFCCGRPVQTTSETKTMSEIEIEISVAENEIVITNVVMGNRNPRRYVSKRSSDDIADRMTNNKLLKHDTINYALGIMATPFGEFLVFEDTGLKSHQFSQMSGKFIQIFNITLLSAWTLDSASNRKNRNTKKA